MSAPASRDELRELAMILGEMKTEIVFTGGSIITLLVTDPAAPAIRETFDVDIYIQQSSVARHYKAEALLRAADFVQRHADPICRWRRNDLTVDLMADDANVLGFTNRWYRGAAERAVTIDLGGVELRVITAPFLIATKLEAFDDPGRENGGDLVASHDLEDIIALVDGRPEIVDEIKTSPLEVRTFLRSRIAALIAEPRFLPALVGHLAGERGRATVVVTRLQDAIR